MGIHANSTNWGEPVLSLASIFCTIIADVQEGNSYIDGEELMIGEATATAIVTQGIGTVSPRAAIDLIVDNYSSPYNHGKAQGIYEKAGISGKTIPIGLISTIRFGEPKK